MINPLDWAVTLGSEYWLVAVADPNTADVIWNASAVPSSNPPLAFAYTSNGTGLTGWQTISAVFPNVFVAGYVSETRDFVSETPLPAALPLFATGLGALGLLGWRRKRKAAALAA